MLAEILPFIPLRLAALFDNNQALKSPWPDVPLHRGGSSLTAYKGNFFAVAVGGGRGRDRLELAELMLKAGLKAKRLIHPTAYVSPESQVAEGCQILPAAKICPRSIVGEFSIINTGASVDHECVVGCGCHIAPGAILCGDVKIGDRAFIGAGATILPGLKIGKDAVVGAGAVVTKDVKPDDTVVGIPARPIRGKG